MVLGRRTTPPLSARLLAWIWPQGGWSRAGNYLFKRMMRVGGTPHAIAAGFASGAAVSMTPFMGFHFLLGFAVAWATRGSMLAAAIGTVVGNPWTFPFIWALIYQIGAVILDLDQTAGDIFDNLSFETLLDNFWALLAPMLVGAVPTAIVTWFLFYIPLRRAAGAFQEKRAQRAAEKRARAEREAAVRATANRPQSEDLEVS